LNESDGSFFSRVWKIFVWASTSSLSAPRTGDTAAVGAQGTKYQTFWPRFWAGFVDGLVFVPVGLAGRWVFRPETSIWLQVCWMFLVSFASIAYVVLMHARYGQTLGKMALGVKVLDVSESKLSARQAVLREIVPIVLTIIDIGRVVCWAANGRPPVDSQNPGVGFWLSFAAGTGWFIAELVTMLTNEKRRALHDYIAGSVVVRLNKRGAEGS
jgi:uncharacterized RDD family membrane protein YckC